MSGFRKFAIVGAGKVGSFIVEELLKQKATGAIDDITIVTRPVSPPDRSFPSPPLPTSIGFAVVPSPEGI